MNIYDELLLSIEGLPHTIKIPLRRALKRAKKVEELLGLYREKDTLEKNPYKNIDTKEIKPYYEWACELKTLEDKIKALEEELK